MFQIANGEFSKEAIVVLFEQLDHSKKRFSLKNFCDGFRMSNSVAKDEDMVETKMMMIQPNIR
jgi:hypothetical protein